MSEFLGAPSAPSPDESRTFASHFSPKLEEQQPPGRSVFFQVNQVGEQIFEVVQFPEDPRVLDEFIQRLADFSRGVNTSSDIVIQEDRRQGDSRNIKEIIWTLRRSSIPRRGSVRGTLKPLRGQDLSKEEKESIVRKLRGAQIHSNEKRLQEVDMEPVRVLDEEKINALMENDQLFYVENEQGEFVLGFYLDELKENTEVELHHKSTGENAVVNVRTLKLGGFVSGENPDESAEVGSSCADTFKFKDQFNEELILARTPHDLGGFLVLRCGYIAFTAEQLSIAFPALHAAYFRGGKQDDGRYIYVKCPSGFSLTEKQLVASTSREEFLQQMKAFKKKALESRRRNKQREALQGLQKSAEESRAIAKQIEEIRKLRVQEIKENLERSPSLGFELYELSSTRSELEEQLSKLEARRYRSTKQVGIHMREIDVLKKEESLHQLRQLIEKLAEEAEEMRTSVGDRKIRAITSEILAKQKECSELLIQITEAKQSIDQLKRQLKEEIETKEDPKSQMRQNQLRVFIEKEVENQAEREIRLAQEKVLHEARDHMMRMELLSQKYGSQVKLPHEQAQVAYQKAWHRYQEFKLERSKLLEAKVQAFISEMQINDRKRKQFMIQIRTHETVKKVKRRINTRLERWFGVR